MCAPGADNKEDFHSDLYDIMMKSAQPISQVFAWSDAVATIYFIVQFCAASIWERLLIKSGVY